LRAKNCCSAAVKTKALAQLQQVRFLSVSIEGSNQFGVTSFHQIYTDKIRFLSPSWGMGPLKPAWNRRSRPCLILCTSGCSKNVIAKPSGTRVVFAGNDATGRNQHFRRGSPRAEPSSLERVVERMCTSLCYALLLQAYIYIPRI
jgi:hypothetical protein